MGVIRRRGICDGFCTGFFDFCAKPSFFNFVLKYIDVHGSLGNSVKTRL